MLIEEQSGSVEETLSFLRTVPFFQGLPDEDLESVAGLARTAQVEEGEYVFNEGDEGGAFYVVREGGVDILASRPSGELEKLAHRRKGDTFGELALLNDSAQSASALATAPCTLLRVERDDFEVLLENNRLARRVLASLSRDLRAAEVRLGALDRLSAGDQGSGPDVGDISRVIQRGLMPGEAPMVSGFDIAAGTSLSPEGPGRTLWDFCHLKDGRAALVTLSVQGDGLPPGLYLSVARSLLRELSRDQDDLTGLLARLNSGLAVAVVEGMDQYVEAGVLLPSERGVEWAGAGRCPGAVIRRDGVFDEFSTHGPPLGMLDGFLYGTERMELGAGDAVLVLSEASQGIFRGAADLVASLQGKPVGEVVSTVHKALNKAASGEGVEASVLFVRKQ